MFVIIVGGGKVGTHLAQDLLNGGYKVRLIEQSPKELERLHETLPPEVVISGDGSSPKMLEMAGIREAQVLAAVTGEDETNLVITTLAKHEFGINRTIARVNNPKNAWLFNKDMGVDVKVNQTEILTKLVMEEMSLGDMMVLLRLHRGEYSLVEEKLIPTARMVGVALKDLALPETSVVVAVIRSGTVVMPRGNLVFQAGDEVMAIAHNASLKDLKILFLPKE